MTSEHAQPPTDLVRITRAVPADLPDVWSAITAPERVARWLGDLAAPMTPDADTRIDFGDGDYFDIHVDHVRPRESIGFRWRFLGVGPESRVEWRLRDTRDGTTMTVHDRCPGRPPAEAVQLEAGWTDFIDRLAAHLATGESARYQWRSVIDGGADLATGSWRPLRADTVADWLPLASTSGGPPTWFFVVDGDGPRRFAIRDWKLLTDRSLTFGVEMPEGGTTRCEVRQTTGDTVRLTVSHEGWARLDVGDLQARGLRHRFAAAWREALRLAEDHSRRAPR